MTLKQQMIDELGLVEEDFHTYETDLYVLDKPGVWEWLSAHPVFHKTISRFIGSSNSPWAGKSCIDIPFAA